MLKIFGVVILVVFGLFLFSKETVSPVITNLVSQTPGPTPFLFEEMTIPYLRNKVFKSELGDLEKYQNHANYTSYLTSYKSDGLKVNALLTIPRSTRDAHSELWPAIVFVHGYIAPSIYQTTEKYNDYVDYFARNGFVVFKIDLRGHGSSEGEPGGGYYSGDYVIDTLNAYSALQNSNFVNPSAIGLWGHSMAGNIVLRALAARPEIKAAVVWAGAGYTYTDLQEFRIDDNSYRPPPPDSERQRKRQLLRETYGDFDPNQVFWKQVTPVNYLSEIKGAIEVHHATDDNVVSIDYARNLMNVLDKTTIPHQLWEYSTGGHNITGSSFTLAMRRSVEFFNKQLRR